MSSLDCLLFGELRSLLGSNDFLCVPLSTLGTSTDGNPSRWTTFQQVWADISAAVEHLCDEVLRLDSSRKEMVRGVLKVCLLAVDDEFVDANDAATPVHIDNLRNVAIIPPVSGG